MALITMDGFSAACYGADADIGVKNGWSLGAGVVTTDFVWLSTGGKFGGGALQIRQSGTYPKLIRSISIQTNQARLAFYVKTPAGLTNWSNDGLLRLTNVAGNRWLIMSCNGSGVPQLFKFDDTVPLSPGWTASTAINDGSWHHIEVEFIADPASGTAKMWVDGNLEINQTGVDTSDAVSGDLSSLDQVELHSARSSGAGNLIVFDDLVVWDDTGTAFTGQIGAHKIEGLAVDGAGASAQFTPSAGANYQNVDEANIDDDTTYNQDATVGHKDLFTAGDIPAGALAIRGVMVRTTAKNPDVGTKAFTNKIKRGATEASGTSHTVSGTYTAYMDFFALDPESAGGWTESQINAIQIGYEVVT